MSVALVQQTSGTMWCQVLGRMVAVKQLQGRQSSGLCPFANRGLTGSWNDCLTTAAARPRAIVGHGSYKAEPESSNEREGECKGKVKEELLF